MGCDQTACIVLITSRSTIGSESKRICDNMQQVHVLTKDTSVD